MDNQIQSDLLNAHADALIAGEGDYYERYKTLFREEISELEPLFEIAEELYGFFSQPVIIRPAFRAELKATLIAQAHQQQITPPSARTYYGYGPWSWAALGASAVTVAIAAATWRGSYKN